MTEKLYGVWSKSWCYDLLQPCQCILERQEGIGCMERSQMMAHTIIGSILNWRLRYNKSISYLSLKNYNSKKFIGKDLVGGITDGSKVLHSNKIRGHWNMEGTYKPAFILQKKSFLVFPNQQDFDEYHIYCLNAPIIVLWINSYPA